MIISDLDGTLFQSNHSCSQEDYRTLLHLGDEGHLRVIATGRSLHSAHKVLAQDFPIDYLIFSSGAGIMDWKRKKLILSHSLNPDEVTLVGKGLKRMMTDFMLHYPIPENHHFVYHDTESGNLDFYRRIDVYREFAKKMDFGPEVFGRATQFIAIVPSSSVDIYHRMCEEFKDQKVIRTTSPIDHQSIWIEIFPKAVSKGLAAQFLCDMLNFSQEDTTGIGNDYNDQDLLEFTNYSFVVENAPDVYKIKYRQTSSNNKNGFTNAVNQLIELSSHSKD